MYDNLSFRSDPNSDFPSGLIAFGDDGTGSPFCIAGDGGDRVQYWSQIGGETTCLADSFDAFLVG